VRVLVLGGTLFLGRAVVQAALDRGDDVTTFTRGRTNPGLFPDVEQLHGDRDGDLTPLEGRAWDVAIDTCGYVPRIVRASAELLEPSLDHYTFVSSISVYDDFSTPQSEDDPLASLEDETSEDVQAHYGALKAACERVVQEVFPGRSLLVRAGLIVGPHDPTNRFTYWVTRAADGGDVLAPGSPQAQVQFIDARDLAEWMLRSAEAGLDGAFNAVGPEPPVTMGELLETCVRVSGSDARLVWVDDAFLLEHEVGEWIELPLWVASPELAALHQADVHRALGAGLAFRPLEETIADTLEWSLSPGDQPEKPGVRIPPAGLDREREAALLADWPR
jgi:nucleoside-diphosphate-sugar epimerase